MTELKKLFITLVSLVMAFGTSGVASAALKDSGLEARSARLYHTYNIVLTEDVPPSTDGTPPPPTSGTMPPSAGVTFTPPTPGQPMMPPQGGMPGNFPGGSVGDQQFGPPSGGQFGPPQGGGPNQGQGFNPGSGMNGNGPGNFQFNRNSQQGPEGNQGGMSDEQQQKMQQQQDAQQLRQIQRGLAQMSRSLTPMLKQISKLESQGVTVPQDLKDAITKMTNLLTVVKNAKTMDEVLAAGFEDMQDWMQTINDGRQTLELAARWSQTQKQVTSQLKKLQKTLDRDRALAAKSTMDLSGALSTFQTAVTDLQNSANTAADLVKSGDIEGAYSELEDNFFGNIQDAAQNDQVIQTLLHLSKFDKEFQKQFTATQKTVAKLKKKGIDTTEMEGLLSQISDKGAEINGLIKAQPFDQDTTESAMNDLQDLTQQLQGLIDDAGGQTQPLPWQQGNQQFKQVPVPDSVGNMFTPMNQNQ